MLSTKLTFLLVIIGCCNLSVINGQFGFSRPFFQNSQSAQGGFTNQNTNFNQHRGGSFGVVAEFGSGQSSTNFQQQNSGAGFSNFGNSFGGFRNAPSNAEEQNIVSSGFRYASPYDEPTYVPKHIVPNPVPAPAPYHHHHHHHYPSPVKCPQNLLVGCAPQVQYVPCQPPPPPPPPSAAYPSRY